MWNKIVRLVCGLAILSAFSLATPIKSDDLFDKIKLELESLSQPITSTVKPTLPDVSSSTAAVSVKNDPPTNRRVITYDQRQDGKYNIRADLENFVILVVPPNPSSGSALLDMLTRPNLKNSQRKNPSKKYQKPKKTEKAGDDQKINSAENSNDQPKIVDHFIEGRTPYHVDLSGLESDAIVVGRSQLPVQSQINQFPVSVTPLRNAKAIIDSTSNQLRSNSVVAILTKPNKINSDRKSYNHNSNNDDDDVDDDNDHDLTDPQNSFDSLNLDNVDTIDRLAVQSQVNDGTDGWELTLLGAQEQCGPDRKRDSYGICQFLPQDYR